MNGNDEGKCVSKTCDHRYEYHTKKKCQDKTHWHDLDWWNEMDLEMREGTF